MGAAVFGAATGISGIIVAFIGHALQLPCPGGSFRVIGQDGIFIERITQVNLTVGGEGFFLLNLVLRADSWPSKLIITKNTLLYAHTKIFYIVTYPPVSTLGYPHC